MRNTVDPYGGNVPMVDKMLGNAYTTVKMVALNMDTIEVIASSMGKINLVAGYLAGTRLVTGTAGALGSTTVIPFPEGITAGMLSGCTVLLVTSTGDVYSPGTNTFTWTITGGSLRVTTSLSGSGFLEGAEIRWNIHWSEPDLG